MPAGGKPTPRLDFWHCRNCHTPNPITPSLRTCLICGAPRPLPKEPAQTVVARRNPWGALVVILSWTAALVALGYLALIHFGADRWWPATALEYAPRWPLLVPLPLLVLGAWWTRRRSLWGLHAASLIVIVGPVMGLSVPSEAWFAPKTTGPRIRIMTFNKGTGTISWTALRRLVEAEKVDVVCLQEARGVRESTIGLAPPWKLGRKVGIVSRLPILEVQPYRPGPFPEYGFWPVRLERVRLELPDGRPFVLESVHMPTPRTGMQFLKKGDIAGHERYNSWRWEQMGELALALNQEPETPIVAAGDFNMPADSRMMDLLRPQFRDAFGLAGWGFGYSRPSAWPWIGIDHVLVSPEWVVRRCWVGPDLGSDHLPLIAELELRPAVAPASPRKP